MESAAPQPWDQGQGLPPGCIETDRQYAVFRRWLEIGPSRTHEDLRRIGCWTPASTRALKSKYRWGARAQAYDAFLQTPETPPEVVDLVLAAVAPPDPEPEPQSAGVEFRVTRSALLEFQRRAKEATAKHQAKLADYRDRMEELGRTQSRAARNLLVMGSKALMEHNAYSELSPKEREKKPAPYVPLVRVADLMRTANSLAASGAELEGRALAVDQLMVQIESIAQVDQWIAGSGRMDPEDLLELLPAEALEDDTWAERHGPGDLPR